MYLKPFKSFLKRVIPLTSVAFLSCACASLFFSSACKPGELIPVFGFDLDHAILYHGKIEKPDKTIGFNDPVLKQYVAMSLVSWQGVLNLLSTCH